MDPRKCQTATVSPAEPGVFPLWINALSPGRSGLLWSSGIAESALERGVGLNRSPRAEQSPTRRGDFPRRSDHQADRHRVAPISVSQPRVWVGWWGAGFSRTGPPAAAPERAASGVRGEGPAAASLCSRWVGIFSITTGSSIQAMILSAPPQAWQVSSGTSRCPPAARQSAPVHIGFPADLSRSMPRTRLRRCAQRIAARRSAGVFSCPSSPVLDFFPLPRLAGVTCARCLLSGTKTPWKRVRLSRGLRHEGGEAGDEVQGV